MNKILSLALLATTLPFAASAATLTPCVFPKYGSEVMPIPSSSYLKYRIVTGNANVSSTQAVPTKTGHIVWACQSGGANWQQCWYNSAGTNFCGTAAPVVSSAATDWDPNPVCRMLDAVSGTIPNTTGVQSDTSTTWVGGSYCYQ